MLLRQCFGPNTGGIAIIRPGSGDRQRAAAKTDSGESSYVRQMSLCFKRFDRRSGAADRFSPDAFLTAMPTRNPPPGRLFLIQRGARTRLFAPMTPDGTVQPRHEIGGDVRRCLESNAHRVRSQCSVVVQGGAPACGPAPAPDICSSKTLGVPRGRYLYRRCAHPSLPLLAARPSLPRRSDVQT